MQHNQAKYNLGQVVQHKLFGYRGVVIDVDPSFQHTEEWYSLMATMKPSKEQPWYRVLIDDTDYISYVAEQNIEITSDGSPIQHPDVEKYFSTQKDGAYILKQVTN